MLDSLNVMFKVSTITNMIKIGCIADSHMQIKKIAPSEGDILIHAGDFTYDGSIRQMGDEIKRLKEYGKGYKHIVAICGNHDWIGERQPEVMEQLCKDNNIVYLKDSGIELMGKKIWGSPWQPEFCNWAFNLERGAELKAKWDLVPRDTNILITHGPVEGLLDLCPDGRRVGCKELFDAVQEIKPELHICGHIHHSYGMLNFNGTTFVNASSCDEKYMPINKPIMIEL